MSKNWYVIHTYAGYEGRVRTSVLERMNQMGMSEVLGQVSSKRKFFPGYVLLEAEGPLSDEAVAVIKDTPKVTGFVGGGVRPVPLEPEEAETLLKQLESGVATTKERVSFTKGDSVRIIDGPFLGFNGLVDEVDPDHSRVKALVSIFGRSTPVELAFSQVERA
jgi:transcriptional antiterminator NusG